MTRDDDVPFHLLTSCQVYGHNYEDTDYGTRRCIDCGDEYELDEESR
jgi:hypothetical protein